MRWTPGGVSGDIEDRRGGGGFRGAGFGGGGGGMKLGLGGMLILLVLSFVFKIDLLSLFSGMPVSGPTAGIDGGGGPPASESTEERQMVQFVSFVLDDAQATWQQLFPQIGGQYQNAKLVLFRDAVQSACGFAQAASGPFYCPGDLKVYIDLSFFDELHRRFGAPGDFAQAYVLAHELGHHVQRLAGYEARVRQAQRSQPGAANQLSVRLELQADCFAGVWGHAAAQRGKLEPDDVEEGLRAAAAIGDDRIQKMAGRTVSPESWTHGSSAQRVAAFKKGLESGRPGACEL
jgi:predicted metalloprotease